MSSMPGFTNLSYPWETAILKLQEEVGKEDGQFYVQICALQSTAIHTLRCDTRSLEAVIGCIHNLHVKRMLDDEIIAVTLYGITDYEKKLPPVILIFPSVVISRSSNTHVALLPMISSVASISVERAMDHTLVSYVAIKCPISKILGLSEKLIRAETKYYVEDQEMGRFNRNDIEKYRKYIIKGMKDLNLFQGGMK